MSFIARNLHRIGAAITDQQWQQLTEKFVILIKEKGYWDVVNDPFGPEDRRPFKMINFSSLVEKQGGRFFDSRQSDWLAIASPAPSRAERTNRDTQ